MRPTDLSVHRSKIHSLMSALCMAPARFKPIATAVSSRQSASLRVIVCSRRRVTTAWNHIVAVRSSFRRAPHDSARLPQPFATKHASLECRRIPVPVAAVAGLGVAKIEVGIKDGIAARLSIGTHQIVIRVLVMVGLRGESRCEEQSASDDGAFHSIVLGSDSFGSNFLGTTAKRSSRRLRRRFIKGGRFGSKADIT
jgi:hypothetical protein